MGIVRVNIRLWFDVGVKRYTTMSKIMNKLSELWFDVGVKRYTTQANYMCYKHSCGLM